MGINALRPLTLLILVSTVTAAHSADPLMGFMGAWYANGADTVYGRTYSGAVATYPQQTAPLAVYRPEVDRTYFVFNANTRLQTGLGEPLGHAISYLDHATGLVSVPRLIVDKQTSNGHDAPTLTIDDQGYLYVFSSTHGDNRRSHVWRSNNPHDVTGFTDLSDDPQDLNVFGTLPGHSETTQPRFSYAGSWHLPGAADEEDLLLLFTRYRSHERDLFSARSVDGDVWSDRTLYAEIERGQYQSTWIKPDGVTVGTMFNVHPEGGVGHRSDLYYMETPDLARTWRTASGQVLLDASSPALDTRPTDALVYESGVGERVYLRDLNYDAQGNPLVLFTTSSRHIAGPAQDRRVRFGRWTGSEWAVSAVTWTDHNYDHGSLYVHDDGSLSVVGPFLVGPQAYAAGGRLGRWTSTDGGESWDFDAVLTDDPLNASYLRRPLDAHPDLWSIWGSADSLAPGSSVSLSFANEAGDVFDLPMTIDAETVVAVDPATGVELVQPTQRGPAAQRLPGDISGDGVVDIEDYYVWRSQERGPLDHAQFEQWSAVFRDSVEGALILHGDFDGDGDVDVDDFGPFAHSFLHAPQDGSSFLVGDFDEDGDVDADDFGVFANGFQLFRLPVLPGDFDGDGDVDVDDFGVFANGFQITLQDGTAVSPGDFDGDGDVDTDDFGVFVNSFQLFLPAPAAIPEPATPLLTTAGLLAGLTWRQR